MHFKNEYAFLSNMHMFKEPIIIENIKYYSSENYYIAMKTNNIELRQKISKMEPRKAKTYFRKLIANLDNLKTSEVKELQIRSDWNDIKFGVMKYICKIKFNLEPYKTLLLNTEDKLIVEDNNWGDTYWGCCNGKGKNKLGLIIMEIRDELKGKSFDLFLSSSKVM